MGSQTRTLEPQNYPDHLKCFQSYVLGDNTEMIGVKLMSAQHSAGGHLAQQRRGYLGPFCPFWSVKFHA